VAGAGGVAGAALKQRADEFDLIVAEDFSTSAFDDVPTS
jgi:hypothetical protein